MTGIEGLWKGSLTKDHHRRGGTPPTTSFTRNGLFKQRKRVQNRARFFSISQRPRLLALHQDDGLVAEYTPSRRDVIPFDLLLRTQPLIANRTRYCLGKEGCCCPSHTTETYVTILTKLNCGGVHVASATADRRTTMLPSGVRFTNMKTNPILIQSKCSVP